MRWLWWWVGIALIPAVLGYALIPPWDYPLEYLELTTGGAGRYSSLPLIVAIHGRSSSPSEFADAFKSLTVPARIILPRAPDRFESGGSWYPLNDVLRRPVVIRARTAAIAALIEATMRTRPTVGRPVVTGFSQGGVMSFSLAATYPDRIAAAFPIAATQYAGMGRPAVSLRPPIFHAFHGLEDPVMPIAGARNMVAAMQASGSSSTLTDYESTGHELSPAIRSQLLREIEQVVREMHSVLPIEHRLAVRSGECLQ